MTKTSEPQRGIKKLNKALAMTLRKDLLEFNKEENRFPLQKEIREKHDISEGTWDCWRLEDTKIDDWDRGFRTFLNDIKREKLSLLAHDVLEETLKINPKQKDLETGLDKWDSSLVATRAKVATDIKKHTEKEWKQKIDHTSNEEPIQIAGFNYVKPEDHEDSKDTI